MRHEIEDMIERTQKTKEASRLVMAMASDLVNQYGKDPLMRRLIEVNCRTVEIMERFEQTMTYYNEHPETDS